MKGYRMTQPSADFSFVRDRIDDACEQSGLSLPDLAVRIGIKERTLRAWRAGESCPNLRLWRQFEAGVKPLLK
jgi:ribosome-binding protein aMBF1 (putative translation factor)